MIRLVRVRGSFDEGPEAKAGVSRRRHELNPQVRVQRRADPPPRWPAGLDHAEERRLPAALRPREQGPLPVGVERCAAHKIASRGRIER